VHALIIEDEFLIALALEDMLSELGFLSFDWAATEDEAIAAVRRRRPDLITADIHLRVGNGISAIEAIRSDEPGIPTVFITANDSLVAQMKGTTVLSKPIRLADLARAIASARQGAGLDPSAPVAAPTHFQNARDARVGSR
jgi:two-component system, response regulator PdtaR